MNKRPRHSRWSRLPATFRSGEKRVASPSSDQQRLTLYLPSHILERAEALARKAGAESVQRFCEDLICQAIEHPDHPPTDDEPEGSDIEVDWVEDIATDPAFRVTWPATMRPASNLARSEEPRSLGAATVQSAAPQPRDEGREPPPTAVREHASRIVMRHAALDDDFPEGLIATLRRGDRIEPGPAQELLQALIDLERAFQETSAIDRRLAFALHRLAFEGQLLLTDAWPGLNPEQSTVETLRLVQEAVDRVLSGEDIRYYQAEDDDHDRDLHQDD